MHPEDAARERAEGPSALAQGISHGPIRESCREKTAIPCTPTVTRREHEKNTLCTRELTAQAVNAITYVQLLSLRRLAVGLLPAGRDQNHARRSNLYSFIAPDALDRDA